MTSKYPPRKIFDAVAIGLRTGAFMLSLVALGLLAVQTPKWLRSNAPGCAQLSGIGMGTAGVSILANGVEIPNFLLGTKLSQSSITHHVSLIVLDLVVLTFGTLSAVLGIFVPGVAYSDRPKPNKGYPDDEEWIGGYASIAVVAGTHFALAVMGIVGAVWVAREAKRARRGCGGGVGPLAETGQAPGKVAAEERGSGAIGSAV